MEPVQDGVEGVDVGGVVRDVGVAHVGEQELVAGRAARGEFQELLLHFGGVLPQEVVQLVVGGVGPFKNAFHSASGELKEPFFQNLALVALESVGEVFALVLDFKIKIGGLVFACGVQFEEILGDGLVRFGAVEDEVSRESSCFDEVRFSGGVGAEYQGGFEHGNPVHGCGFVVRLQRAFSRQEGKGLAVSERQKILDGEPD